MLCDHGDKGLLPAIPHQMAMQSSREVSRHSSRPIEARSQLGFQAMMERVAHIWLMWLWDLRRGGGTAGERARKHGGLFYDASYGGIPGISYSWLATKTCSFFSFLCGHVVTVGTPRPGSAWSSPPTSGRLLAGWFQSFLSPLMIRDRVIYSSTAFLFHFARENFNFLACVMSCDERVMSVSSGE